MSLTNATGPRTVAWFHCFSGVAGDMALGSLLDAGADFDEVMTLLRRIPISGWDLEARPALRGGIAATRAVVTVRDTVVVRTYSHIVGLIGEARLPERVATRALDAFGALAEVESRLHRRPVEQTRFHEVGGHDTIVDVVGTAAALEVLGIDEILSSPVATGLGMVRAAHGLLPNPAPAVVALLEGVPTWGRNTAVELTTPTGAALISSLSSGFGPMPPMRVSAQGFGAGARELDELPNCTQVVIGVLSDRRSGSPLGAGPVSLPSVAGDDSEADAGQPVAILEVTVDDATGEQLAHAVQALLDAGAYDAWLVPVVMKKGRPGFVVQVLGDPVITPRLRSVLRTATGSLGVRMTVSERWPAARAADTVSLDGHLIRMKVSPGTVKAEHDDVARVARLTARPLREVASRAEAAWREGADRTQSGRPAPRQKGADTRSRGSGGHIAGTISGREAEQGAPGDEPPEDDPA